MRMPKMPPSEEELREAMKNPDRLMRLLSSNSEITAKGKYLHWDKLRFHAPPEGMSHKEWWLSIKLHRKGHFKSTPLIDTNKNPFMFLEIDPMGQHLHEIDLGCAGTIQMPDPITNPDTRNQYYVSSLIEEAITSSQLEGAATTRRVAKDMIKSGRPPVDRSEQMILNNYRTMQKISAIKHLALTPKLVKMIHHIATRDTLDDPTAAGRFRRESESVVVADMYNETFHEPPPADQLESRMEMMCRFANGKKMGQFIHPVLRSIILHFWLAYDHPFIDGNGRTARALFYWSMLHHQYGLFEFISISQIIRKAPAKYGRAFLYTETDENDLTYFILYHLHVIRRAIKELHAYLRKQTERVKETERIMEGIASLNHRQRALISHALRHPQQRYTIRSHQTSHNIVYQTSRHDLLVLENKQLLDRGKIGRGFYYTPAKVLQQKLQSLRQ